MKKTSKRGRSRNKVVPDVTVITPTFNRGHLVAGAIKSVLNQSFKNFNYFIVDDGSSDNTKKIVAPYLKDSRVFYFHQTNAGQASALNLGAKFARSPWLAFLDSDDEYRPDHLEYLLSKAKADKNLDLVIGSFKLVGGDSKKIRVVDYHHPTKTIALEKVEVVCGTILVKRAAVLECGGFQGILSDIDLVTRLKKSGASWQKAKRATLKYYFGRSSDSLSLQELKRRRKKSDLKLPVVDIRHHDHFIS